jgi:dCMP deaminase
MESSARKSKDEYFLDMAHTVSSRSTCGRRSVGCVLVDKYGYIKATGYNGVPKGFDHCIDKPCPGLQYKGDPEKLHDCYAVHAEMNAILQLSGNKEGVTKAYTTVSPCRECAKVLANSFVTDIYTSEIYKDPIAEAILEGAGITVHRMERVDG